MTKIRKINFLSPKEVFASELISGIEICGLLSQYSDILNLYIFYTLTIIVRKSWEKDWKFSPIFSTWEYFCQNWPIIFWENLFFKFSYDFCQCIAYVVVNCLLWYVKYNILARCLIIITGAAYYITCSCITVYVIFFLNSHCSFSKYNFYLKKWFSI